MATNHTPLTKISLALTVLLLLVPTLVVADWRFEEVVRSGDPLRGPGTSDYTADQFVMDQAYLDASGSVVFRGFAEGPGGEFGDGLWRVTDGVARLMAMQSAAVPGIPDRNYDLSQLEVRLDASGNLALGVALVDDAFMVWEPSVLEVAPDGSADPVMLTGDVFPFPIPPFDELTMRPFAGPFQAGRHLITPSLEWGYDQLSQRPLLTVEPDHSLILHGITREDAMPLVAGGFRLQSFQHMVLNTSGQFAVVITGDDGDVESLARGLYRNDPVGGWELIDYDTGFNVNLFDLQVEHLTINASGTLAWVGKLPNYFGEGVWIARPGEAPELVIPVGGQMDETPRIAESFSGVVLTDGDVAVTKVNYVGGGNGLYATAGGGLVQTIATTGDPTPGIPDASYGGSAGIGGYAASTDGIVAFTSGVDFDSGSPETDALFAGTTNTIDLIVRRGWQIESTDGSRIRANTIRFPGSPYDNTFGEGFTGSGADGFPTVLQSGGQLLFEVWESNFRRALIVASRGITVNSVADAEDLDDSDGTCDTGQLNPDGDPECTLRAAIMQANLNPGSDRIDFAIPGPAPYQIQPASPLPPITGPTSITGPTYSVLDPDTQQMIQAPAVELDGGNMDAVGLTVGEAVVLKRGGPQDGKVMLDRLVIGAFREAISIQRDSTVVVGCRIGIRSDGTPFSGGIVGVELGVSSYCRIGMGPARDGRDQGNVIIGQDVGVRIRGNDLRTAKDNCIQGNVIGRERFVSPGRNGFGIVVQRAENTLIGGAVSTLGNIIAGNDSSGIRVQGIDTRDTRIMGNTIGTPANSNVMLGNGLAGIEVWDAIGTTIGGQASAPGVAPGNRISGNPSGVRVRAVTQRPKHTTILGNLIGASSAARASIDGNTGTGVFLADADSAQIGDGAPADANLISGNTGVGLRIEGTDVVGLKVQGNRIGLGSDGVTPVGNAVGVTLELEGEQTDPSSLNFAVRVGEFTVGSELGHGNVISGNRLDGIRVFGQRGLQIFIEGNWIGLDAQGETIVGIGGGRQQKGIALLGANRVRIGGLSSAQGNVVAGHQSAGIEIESSEGILVLSNRVGSSPDGQSTLPMAAEDSLANRVGILVKGSSRDVEIGQKGPVHGSEGRNIVAGNGVGIQIDADDNFIRNNFVGLAADGRPFESNRGFLGNRSAGILVRGRFNEIGGSEPGEGNHIAGNSLPNGREDDGAIGLWIEGGGSFAPAGNRVFGNHIGLDPDARVARNDIGVLVGSRASNTLIGAATTEPSNGISTAGDAPGNVISGNRRGLWLRGGAEVTEIYGNLIGPAPDGTTLDPGAGMSIAQHEGIVIESGASRNHVGGLLATQTNVISDNFLVGVRVRGETTLRNQISGNYIGTQRNPELPLPNGRVGVTVSSGAPETLIGWQATSQETAPEHTNLIRFHSENGISLLGAESARIRMNRIENNEVGIRLEDSARAILLHNRLIDNRRGLLADDSAVSADIFHEIYRDTVPGGTAATLGQGKVNFLWNDIQVDDGETLRVGAPTEGVAQHNNFHGAVAPTFINPDPQSGFDLRLNYFSSTPDAEGFDTSEPLAEAWNLHPTFGPKATLNLPSGIELEIPLYIQSPGGVSRDVELRLMDAAQWLDFQKSTLQVTLDPEWGAIVQVPLQPTPTKGGLAETEIWLEANWADDPSVVYTDTITVRVYDAVLSKIAIDAPSESVEPGSFVQFAAAGLDQMDQFFDTAILWSANDGSIDEEGRWTAPSTSGSYEITASDPSGTVVAMVTVMVAINVGLPEEEETPEDLPHSNVPRELMLQQNWPNPFNPSTTISFGLPRDSRVSLVIYNTRGERVRALVPGDTLEAGYHQLVWNGQDDRGSRVSSGVYFYRLQSDQRIVSKKMLMVK